MHELGDVMEGCKKEEEENLPKETAPKNCLVRFPSSSGVVAVLFE